MTAFSKQPPSEHNPVLTDAFLKQGIALAHTMAITAMPTDVPVGAVLFEGETPIAAACNRRERDNNPIAHAEMLVLQEAGRIRGDWRLNNTILFVTLEPCPMCAAALLQARVSTIVFGAYDPLIGACGSRSHRFPDSANVQIIGGVEEAQCQKLLKDYFERQR
jgi:tRNA(adenine34) deaminase